MSKIQNEDIKSESDITGAGGTASQLPNDDKIWVKALGINKTLNAAIVAGDISGGVGKNYLQAGNAEGSNPFTMYADGAASPVDGTGGSPTATITISATSPLSGSKSFIFTSGALGNGGAAPFTLEVADKSSMQTLVVSTDGAFASGDLSVWLYDVTNSVLISPQPTQFLSPASGKQQFIFQMGTGTSYKFLIHQATANSFTAKFEMSLSAMPFAGYGPLTTDAVEFDASAGVFIKAVTTDPVFGTITRNEGRFSKNAGMIYYSWQFEQADNTGSSAGSGNYLIKLPYKMDLTKYGVAQNFTDTSGGLKVAVSGNLVANFNGGDFFINGNLYVYDEQNLYVAARTQSGSYNFWSASFGQLNTAGVLNFNLNAQVHTLGLSAETKVISEYDGRVVALIAQGNPASASAGNPIIFPTATKDTHSAYNTTTGEYTVKVAGFYKMHGSVNSGAAGGSLLFAYKNGVSYSGIGAINSNGGGAFSGLIEAAVGDVLTLRCDAAIDSDGQASLNIDMLSGSQQITAGERIIEKGYYPFGTSVTSGTAIGGLTKTFSSHGALNFTSGVFTAPRSDWYRVKFCMHCGATVTPFSIYVNGTQDAELFISNSGALGGGNDTVYLNIGETLDIRSSVSATSANGGAGGRQYLEIMSGAW